MRKHSPFFIFHFVLLAAVCLLPTAYCFAQGTPGTVRCPGQVDTLDSLFRATDSARTTLIASASSSATSISVVSTSAFPVSGSMKIGSEVIYYTSKTTTSFSGLVRGASGTIAASHSSGSAVLGTVLAAHHNTLAQAIICAQQLALAAGGLTDPDLVAIAALSPVTNDILQYRIGAWSNRTPAQIKTDLALTKSDVGLSNVDNTSDANKPVSTAQQTALNNKQTLDADLTAIAGLAASNDDLIQLKAGAWTNRTPAQFKTDLALIKSDVGLSNVDNTSDVGKPVSTATQTALNAKQDLDSDLTAIAALSAANDDFVQRKSGAWANRTVAQVKTDLGLTGTNSGDQFTSTTASKLLGRGSAAGAGVAQEITLGTGLSMSGTTLNVTTGGSGDMLLGTAQTVTAGKTFNDGTIIVNGGDYGATDSSMPGSPVEKSWYLNTNASSRRLFFYNNGAFHAVLQAGVDQVNLASNVTGVLPIANGGTGQTTGIPYDVAFNFVGVPAANDTGRFAATRSSDFVASFSGTVCSAGTAATAQTDFLVKKNGTTVATLRFAASGTTCSIVSPTSTSLAATDVLTVVAPGTPDATLANIAITLKGNLP